MSKRKRRLGEMKRTKQWQPEPDAPVFDIPAEMDPSKLHYLSYEITYDKLEDRDSKLPDEVIPFAAEIFELVHDKPKKAVEMLRPLVEKYPNSPVLANFYGNAHAKAGNDEIARKLVQDNFKRFPNYLFAIVCKLMYLLDERDTKTAGVILEKKLDIGLLYPERHRFHISEFLSYSLAVGWYLAQRGEFEAAESHLARMEEMEPDSPQTRQLERLIDSESIISMPAKVLDLLRRKKKEKRR